MTSGYLWAVSSLVARRLVSPAPAHQIANRCHSKTRGLSRTEELSGHRRQAESRRVSVHN